MVSSCTESQKQLKNEYVNLDSLIKASPKQDTLQYIVQYNTKEDSAGSYNINVCYPEIINYPDPGKRKLFNSLIESEALNSLDVFLMEIADSSLNNRNIYDFINLMNIDYKFYSKNLKFASLLFTIKTYTRLAHHPVIYHKSINFDLTKGELISLENIFPNDSTYLETISLLVRKRLLKNYELDSNWVKTGTLPVPENYPHFNISKDNLIITLDVYQVANFADGTKKVYIPWKEIPNAEYQKYFPELEK